MIWVLAVFSLVASGAAMLRWLRVAQREHYLPGVQRFAARWWLTRPVNVGLAAVAIGAALASLFAPVVAIVAAAVVVVGPLGLGVKARTSTLVWTERVRRLAVLVAFWVITITGAGAVFSLPVLLAFVPIAIPLVIDFSLLVLAPIERRGGDRWVAEATATLERVKPTVVAITGSYGKTSTKNLVAHLLSGNRSVVASPASFNNRMGLARAVNEHLSAGTDIFVAEMGTYGAGEIRDLCSWIKPDIAVITAIGPVHLERMGSVEAIVAAKREILEDAPVAVLSIDHPLLADLAGELSELQRVVTASGLGAPANVVAFADGRVEVDGEQVGLFAPDRAHPVNVACAAAVLVAMDLDPSSFADRMADLPEIPHRRSVTSSELGFLIIDDTFNANPAGAKAALALLGSLGKPHGRKVVVTPGMVELGSYQDEANRLFAHDAASVGVTDLIVVNRTNRRALLRGAQEAGISSVIVFDTRDDAVVWVRERLVDGDVVLYENDLPDHYP
jgi:UDP-N-acetylmuramoyl-tripeptide--D-alanyl-D-alanine ligase